LKKFTVKSVYAQLTKSDAGPSFKRVWKSKFPEKNKSFMWLVEQDAMLAKDNLIKRNWQGGPKCYMCGDNESGCYAGKG
jgi:pullulanase/glycogen debranching enzyme